MAKVYRRKGSPYWWARFYDWKGKRQRESTKQNNKRLAQQYADGLERKASVPTIDPFTVRDAMILAGEKQVRRGNTEKTLEAAYKRTEHLQRILGTSTDLHGDDGHLARLGDLYLDARRLEFTHYGTPIQDSTTKKELLVLTQGMREGQRLGRFQGKPNEVMPEALAEVGNARDRWLPLHEFDALMKQATPHRQKWLIMYVSTGVDVGELHGIRKEDVDLNRSEFGVIHIRGTKTKYRDRWVPLSRDSRAVVEYRLGMSGPMLFAPVWRSQHVRDCMKRWCPKAGIEHVIIKDLRRTFCSWMCQRGVPEFHVIRLMGHGSSEMVRRVYAQLDDSSFERAIGALPSVTNMCLDNVIPIGKHGKNWDTDFGREVRNA